MLVLHEGMNTPSTLAYESDLMAHTRTQYALDRERFPVKEAFQASVPRPGFGLDAQRTGLLYRTRFGGELMWVQILRNVGTGEVLMHETPFDLMEPVPVLVERMGGFDPSRSTAYLEYALGEWLAVRDVYGDEDVRAMEAMLAA